MMSKVSSTASSSEKRERTSLSASEQHRSLQVLYILVQGLRAPGIKCGALTQRLAQPAVVMGGATQPDQFGGDRVERAHPGHRGQKVVEHRIRRVGGVIPRDRPAHPTEILRADT